MAYGIEDLPPILEVILLQMFKRDSALHHVVRYHPLTAAGITLRYSSITTDRNMACRTEYMMPEPFQMLLNFTIAVHSLFYGIQILCCIVSMFWAFEKRTNDYFLFLPIFVCFIVKENLKKN